MDEQEAFDSMNKNLSKIQDILFTFNRKLAYIERLENKLTAIETNNFLHPTEKYFLMRDWSRGEALPLIKGVREDINQIQLPFKEVVDKTRQMESVLLRPTKNNTG